MTVVAGVVGFVVGWVVLIAGGLPTETQRLLGDRCSWWPPKAVGLLSALLEFLGGLGLLRLVIVMSGLGRMGTGKAVAFGALATFSLLEGLTRLALTPRLDDVAVPSLPVVLAARAFRFLFFAA